MAGFTTKETWVTMDDGEELYTKTWTPSAETKARVLFIHGFSDHCNAFGPTFPFLAKEGIEIVGLDQRGWGRSVKSKNQRGLTGPTPRVLKDIANVLETLIPKSPSEKMVLPLFLMGHSMGGAETILFAIDPLYAYLNSRITGYLLASPYIRLHPSTAPFKITVAAGRIVAKFLPHMQRYTALDASYLSPDPAVIQLFKEDPLLHDTGTLEGIAGMLDRAAATNEPGRSVMTDSIPTGAGETRRIWVCHGTEDRICDFLGTQRWTLEDCKVQDKEFKVYEGWLHRINDQEGDKKKIFADDVAKWILDRS